MINNNPSKTSERTELLRNAIEHRAAWFALVVDEAAKNGLDKTFAGKAIFRCGQYHGDTKYPRTDDLVEFADAFANEDVVGVFEMEILEKSDKALNIDFHYCPLVASWLKLGFSEEDLPALCEMAMDGDRGIIDRYDSFEFELGDTIAKGDDVCQIRIKKV